MANESTIMRRVMIALCRMGARVFRNNVGLARYDDGSTVAYGLAPGSADLIGWHSVTVTPEMVGRQVALFLAVEVKSTTGRVSAAQRQFLHVVRRAGGLAFVARSPDEATERMAIAVTVTQEDAL